MSGKAEVIKPVLDALNGKNPVSRSHPQSKMTQLR